MRQANGKSKYLNLNCQQTNIRYDHWRRDELSWALKCVTIQKWGCKEAVFFLNYDLTSGD